MEQDDDTGRRYWDRHAKNYDRSMLLFGGPLRRMVDLVRASLQGADRVLEVAAGTGLVTKSISEVATECVATDYSPEMVERLRERVRQEGLTNVRCQQADIYALPFEESTFDAVVAANVVHLVPDLEAALWGLKRVLRKSGLIVVPTYCHDETTVSRFVSKGLSLTGFPGARRFSVESLKSAVEASGLTVERVEKIPGLLPLAYIEGRKD